MRKYRLEQEVDWRWLLKFLEVEMERAMLQYPRRQEGDSVGLRQAYMNNTLSFYLSLRSFLRLSLTTKTRNRVEEFIENGPRRRR